MNLSPNFTLDELTVSQEAARRGLSNVPTPEVVEELRRLATLVLQPLRDHLARRIVVTSGYRSPAVNSAVGGAKHSAHMRGHAADIIVPGVSPFAVCQIVVALDLPFDQLIHEFGTWCHVGITFRNAVPRRETLTATRNPDGTVRYQKGII